jgi:hypothetical protein
MLEVLHGYDGSAAARQRIVDGFGVQLTALRESLGRGDGGVVARVEAEVKRDPQHAIRVNSHGNATLYAAGRSYKAGRFEVPRLCELRQRALSSRERAGRPACRATLWILDGASPVTDIGALQASAAPGSLFQVASQFNCLESPGRFVAEVAHYFHDPTQGPRASISAFPGTFLRHYAAPGLDGNRFVQSTDGPQLNLLVDVCDPAVARVESGYLRAPEVYDAPAFARALEVQFEAIRIGLHDDIEVVLGADWTGEVKGAPFRTIAQSFTSTIAAGMYGALDDGNAAFATIIRQLQRAAYLGTLLGAAALGMDRVVLTLIGGGVFVNPLPVIWDAIRWATDALAPFLHRDLAVVVNGRNLSEGVAPDVLARAASERGGALIRCERGAPPQFYG